jgi:hypothetical protein
VLRSLAAQEANEKATMTSANAVRFDLIATLRADPVIQFERIETLELTAWKPGRGTAAAVHRAGGL